MFTVVKKYIDEYDYYSLLKNGAPPDEFGNDEKPEKYLELAKKIKAEL